MPVKQSKRYRSAVSGADLAKEYPLKEAVEILTKFPKAKFDETIELSFRLGVDPAQGDQMVRGTTPLPNGSGKKVRVLVFTDDPAKALAAGADFVGLDDYISKIEKGWTDIDVIITMPAVMAKVGRLGRVLGPRGLMPNPKSGTVTTDVAKAVREVKAGKIDFKVDKTGIIHCSVGKVSFDESKLAENALEIIQTLGRLKPSSSKGTYIKSITLSSTMSPGVPVDSQVTSAN